MFTKIYVTLGVTKPEWISTLRPERFYHYLQTYLNAFSWKSGFVIRFWTSLFVLKFPINNKSIFLRLNTWCRQASCHFLKLFCPKTKTPYSADLVQVALMQVKLPASLQGLVNTLQYGKNMKLIFKRYEIWKHVFILHMSVVNIGREPWKRITVKCRHNNPVEYKNLMHTSLQWQGENIKWIYKKHHALPSRKSYDVSFAIFLRFREKYCLGFWQTSVKFI